MPLLPASVCAADENLCRTVLRMTGDERLAEVADLWIGKPVALAIIVVGTLIVRWALHRMVDRVVRKAQKPLVPNRPTSTRRVQRARTIGTLLKSIISGVLVAVAGTMTLSELGFDIAPILASAGIVGIALGFGAQTLVKDFLSGIFMLFEDQYGVGDVVRVGDIEGAVEAVTLRVTRIRDENGTVWYVRNGEIQKVGNMSQNWARANIDVTVSHEADLVRVRQVLAELAEDLWHDDDFTGRIIEVPQVVGVEQVTSDGVTVRLAAKTAPMEQWSVARTLRERIKARFEAEGIVVPHTAYAPDPAG